MHQKIQNRKKSKKVVKKIKIDYFHFECSASSFEIKIINEDFLEVFALHQ